MARGDAADMFFRELRSAGLSRPAVEALVRRFTALEAAAVAPDALERATFEGAATPCPSGSWTPLPWGAPAEQIGDFLDLTDPALPIVTVPGVYVLSGYVYVAEAAGKFALLEVDFNPDGDLFAYIQETFALDHAGGVYGTVVPKAFSAGPYFLPAGADLMVQLKHSNSSTLSAQIGNANLQRVA